MNIINTLPSAFFHFFIFTIMSNFLFSFSAFGKALLLAVFLVLLAPFPTAKARILKSQPVCEKQDCLPTWAVATLPIALYASNPCFVGCNDYTVVNNAMKLPTIAYNLPVKRGHNHSKKLAKFSQNCHRSPRDRLTHHALLGCVLTV